MVTKPTTAAHVIQSGVDPTLPRIVTHSLGLIVLCVALCGCNSIYHQARATMPPDARARLSLRLQEARAVDRSAREAARQLLALLQRSSNGDLIRVGFDRLEREALELDRKVLAVRDELGVDAEVSENREVGALNDQANEWRQFAVENRSVDPRVAAARLESLLGKSAAR